ncbi:hypothetical protein [Confluentibacter flavum]|uniref:Uncharacterized protein n=1 Tax=Confluentibacter flavum TaxID=1909700 RepID=A0A2N3HF36_9FLAO|nr:hypothetical protein [Confluentibacter flavum]PKQ43600.1 hypothetical protein CSW08_16465 [Confluentibacter flavum]
MEHGYLILAIIALLFISMYGYSYIPVVLEKRKEKRLKIEQEELEEARKKENLMKQELRDEKLNKSLKRSAEIKMELQQLEQMKKNKTGPFEEELNQMKVDKMKKQQAG